MLKYNCALNDLYMCVYMCPVVPLVGNDVPLFLLIDSLPQNPAKLSIKVCEQMRKKKKENMCQEIQLWPFSSPCTRKNFDAFLK